MTYLLYVIIFAMGATIGSFCTLAVYRLPISKDITHERSFCPKCNHKLEFLDLIPILSFIFLKGKCRYCKEKIRPRYIIIELFAGLIAVLYMLPLKIDLLQLDFSKIIDLFFGMLYITGLTIIAGIDKEKKQVQKSVLIYNFIITAIYIIYLFTVGNANINRYAIYLFFMFVLASIYFVDKQSKNKRNMPIAFLVCVFNIIVMIVLSFITNYFAL